MNRLLCSLAMLVTCGAVEANCPSLLGTEFGDPDEQLLFGGGSVDGLAAVAQSLIALSAGTDSNNATVKYSVSGSRASDAAEGTVEFATGCTHALSVSLSSPIDKSDKITDLATLDGLANAFTLSLTYSQYRDRIVVREGRNAEAADGLDVAKTWFWGSTATIGREQFKFVNFDDFEKAKQDKRPWSYSAFLGSELGQWTITGRVKIERSYKDQEAITRCRPISASMDLDCLAGPPGQPNREKGRQLSIEFRSLLFGGIGIAPTISRDFEKHVTGINLPMFMWQDSKGQLTGGWRMGWRDDTNDLEFGVFVSQPF